MKAVYTFLKSSASTVYLYALAYAVLLSSICFLIGFNGLYGQDSYEYLRYAKALHNCFEKGNAPGSFFWPVGYPFLGATLGILIRNIEVSMLLITIISSSITFLFLYKIITLLYEEANKEVPLFLVLFFCLSPFIFRSSIVVMSDMMTVAGICMAYYFFLLFHQDQKLRFFLLFTFCATLSITTRYAAVVVLILPILYSIFVSIKNNHYFHLKSGTLIALLVLIPHFYFKPKAPFNFLRHDWLALWSPLNFFRDTFITTDGLHHYPFINSVYVFSNMVYPGYLFAGIFFLWFTKKELFTNFSTRIIFCSIFLYALFLAGMPIQNQRFLLLTYPLLLVLFYPSFLLIIQKTSVRNYFKIIVCSALLLQILLVYRAFLPRFESNKSEKEIVTSLKKYADRKIIYTSGMEGALWYYETPQVRRSLYPEKIFYFEAKSLVLLNPTEIESQWKNKNPELNWSYLKQHYTLLPLETLPAGWMLYEIK